MTRAELAATPDGIASPAWIIDTASKTSVLPNADAPDLSRPIPAQAERRKVVDMALAAKLLGAHLSNRSQLMPIRPTDLSGLSEERAVLLVRAMAAAGHADGGVEAEELARLEDIASSGVIAPDRRRALLDELREPPSIEALFRQVTDAATAERFYAVSAWVIRRDRPTCRAYLAYLAVRLGIPGDVRIRIDEDVERLTSAPAPVR